ncbi:LysR family transcriptional regulator [Phyllobacterium sp. SB3]|uniref:LysR family transcriptional regulator n=1 Tax=Phyllobacterium sp. SB3 TaxID=3156073 RepID=UPI0032B002E3
MTRIVDLKSFVAVAEYGSLTQAARALKRPLQAVSRSLAALEAEVGIELIHRTTRQSTLSEAGRIFFLQIKPALSEIESAKSEAMDRRSAPSGTLRIGAPVLFGPDYLVPVIAGFMRENPQIEVELQLTDAFSDLADDRLDLVLRIADLPDSGLQGKRLGELRRVVFGSPAYFAQHGRPAHPSELKGHSCIVRTINDRSGQWKFRAEGKPLTVSVRGAFRTNTMTGVYSAVRSGIGLGYSPLWQIKRLVENDEVQIVLERFEPDPVPIHALWQENKFPPAKVRAFVDYLARQLRL